MNFNKENKEQRRMHIHNPINHLIHMILCCGLPILIVFSLPLISRYSPALSGLLGIIAPFICPIMMGGMMIMMFRKKDMKCCKNTKDDNSEL
ncbi:hypothetical protein [Anaeromicropila herbilytica]|uniref:DUF2933 domain-containing protein n=1 Tax=Anaeromicropila herbilytica TaxID=2785025 RepID=A0A7R7EIT9_9FIRM|nr:hypothetical protein [Anaeromicropila herbilytica]BCN29577.1 hypothetical protein bsdtb5_08720 [Anaeromicropila herbilytica]